MRFNVSVPLARVPETASTLRERSARPKISRNECEPAPGGRPRRASSPRSPVEIGAFEVGNVAYFSCPEIDGANVGAADGSGTGTSDGRDVGRALGFSVGSGDGSVVGTRVGASDGGIDGLLVGGTLGSDDGRNVG